jgi:hypothetical protein
MAVRGPGEGEIDPTPGLAGGPGPTPPGVEDGTATPRLAEPEPAAPAAPGPEEIKEEAEAAERSAGVRRADVPGLAGDREGRGGAGGDPQVEESERRTRR